MERPRRLGVSQIQNFLNEWSDEDDLFADSGSAYSPSEKSNIDLEDGENTQPGRAYDEEIEIDRGNESAIDEIDGGNESAMDENDGENESTDDEIYEVERLEEDNVNEWPDDIIIWTDPQPTFKPRFTISQERIISNEGITRGLKPLEVFFKLLPRSFIHHIVYCTNERIDIHNISHVKNKRARTDFGEILIILGCTFVMSYNRVPSLKDYFSNSPSLGNPYIKKAMSRDRFLHVMSKLYFSSLSYQPDPKPKTYFIDDLVNCLKSTFQKCRSDSPFQSIDESMTKFLGRSTLKQYMPLKPVKRGIKLWMRCDSMTGYTYDFNIYSGKEDNSHTSSTLGERVVMKLASTIRYPDTTLCFDRFFTSTKLINNIPFPALGTCISNRKNLPKVTEKLNRGEYVFKCNSSGTLAVVWQDTKQVMLLSNCHEATVGTVQRKQKDGTRVDVTCPDLVKTYRNIMGGVDLADKMVTLYELDRKSAKWWRKVFFRLMMTCAVNAWIIHAETNHPRQKREPFLGFLVELSECLIDEGKKNAKIQRKVRTGPVSAMKKKIKQNLGDHLPQRTNKRQRCVNCAKKGKESRTNQICIACNLAFCKKCFTPCHQI